VLTRKSSPDIDIPPGRGPGADMQQIYPGTPVAP